MAKVKAHIVFDDDRVGKPLARSKMLKKVQQAVQLSEINEKRFEDYGVLTATIDEAKLAAVRKIPGVASVEVDEKRGLQ